MKLIAQNVAIEVNPQDLPLDEKILIEPATLIAILEGYVYLHTKNAEGKSDYLRGYHQGAAERFKFLVRDIKASVHEKSHQMANGADGLAIKAHIIVTL